MTEHQTPWPLARPGSQYTDEQKRQAIVLFLTLGNMVKVSEQTGIPNQTLSGWKNHSDWWDLELGRIREEKKEEFSAKLSGTIDKAVQVVNDRLDDGDEVVFSNGTRAYRKVSGKDATIIAGTFFDKRQILNNQPTSITASPKALEDLAKRFEQIVQEKDARIVSSQ